MSQKSGIVVGVDGGATKTNVVALELNGKKFLKRWNGPCSNMNSVGEESAKKTIQEGIRNVVTESGFQLDQVVGVALGLSGVDRPDDKVKVNSWMDDLFGGRKDVKIGIYNDAIASLASGTEGKLANSAVLISGTGVIAYGFDANLKEKRAAGWGPLLGDEGAGYQIGYNILRAVVSSHDGRGEKTSLVEATLEFLKLPNVDGLISWAYSDTRVQFAKFAELAPLALRCSEKGDAVAEAIVQDTVHHLFKNLDVVVKRLDLESQPAFTLVLSGGNLTFPGSRYGQLVTEKLKQAYGDKVTVTFPKIHPEEAVALLVANELEAQEK
eukprot:TRINITY_DN3433_c1_g3_i1.p1 TRINITY_DN3433_c1_g3~~TRINITY_DN3433_c1_g3_i1.p1  ORF type:complete len:325 (-),score=128.71 TRINITY_DN3433_c1_g3_i1:21-995(-)